MKQSFKKATRHTRMKMIEDRLSYIEARLMTIEKIAEVWFEALDPNERQMLVETATEQVSDDD